jgi:uncharacterized protein YidB (DUF937 family)
MSRGFPSMTALLGLLAIAGYQNRDKIAEFLRGAQPDHSQGPQSGSAGGAIPGICAECWREAALETC